MYRTVHSASVRRVREFGTQSSAPSGQLSGMPIINHHPYLVMHREDEYTRARSGKGGARGGAGLEARCAYRVHTCQNTKHKPSGARPKHKTHALRVRLKHEFGGWSVK